MITSLNIYSTDFLKHINQHGILVLAFIAKPLGEFTRVARLNIGQQQAAANS